MRRYLIFIALLGFARIVEAGWTILPRLNASGTYSDNVSLAPAGAQQTSDLITEIEPGLTVDRQGHHSQLHAQYSLDEVYFQDNNNWNRQLHHFDGMAELATEDGNFKLDLTGFLGNQYGSAQSGMSLNRYNTYVEPAYVSVVGLSPKLNLLRGSGHEIRLEAEENVVSLLGSNADAVIGKYRADMRLNSPQSRSEWSLNANATSTDYYKLPGNSVENATAGIAYSYSFPRSARLTMSLGYDQNDSTVAGVSKGEGGGNVGAGFQIADGHGVDLQFHAANRYYGDVYQGKLDYKGGRFDLGAEIDDQIQSRAELISASLAGRGDVWKNLPGVEQWATGAVRNRKTALHCNYTARRVALGVDYLTQVRDDFVASSGKEFIDSAGVKASYKLSRRSTLSVGWWNIETRMSTSPVGTKNQLADVTMSLAVSHHVAGNITYRQQDSEASLASPGYSEASYQATLSMEF
ncbi:MAG: TIGR03016 family PEP-CTERM system-associated outer membrane protein [Gammaproteobacteria bacterium]|nr:TIGR03016 family PEP-CTERM system-associated outer membrane protein [Gammaproteobacteria bacterium]